MLPLIGASIFEHDALIEAAGSKDLVRANGWVAAFKTPKRFHAAVAEIEALAPHGLRSRVLDLGVHANFYRSAKLWKQHPGSACVLACRICDPLSGPHTGIKGSGSILDMHTMG